MPVISREFHAVRSNYTPGGNSMRYLVIHYTGSPGTARNTAKWQANGGNPDEPSSFHYVLDGSGVIYQILDDTDTAWAVGAWPGYTQLIGNSESISIEVCSNGEDFTTDEIAELQWLVHRLMERYGIDAAHVVRHWDCHTGRKECPAPYCGSVANDRKWEALRKVITGGDMNPVDVWLVKTGPENTPAVDRLIGIDKYMPQRMWDMPLKANGGSSKQTFPAWQYLSNVDHRCDLMQKKIDALEKKIDLILKAVS